MVYNVTNDISIFQFYILENTETLVTIATRPQVNNVSQ